MKNKEILKVFLNTFDSKATQTNYEIDIKDFSKFLNKKDKDLDNATSFDIEDFKSYLKDKGLADTTRARRISSLKSFYKFLYEIDMKDKNIAKAVKVPKIDTKKEPTYLTMKEVQKMLSVIDGSHAIRDKAIVMLFVSTGLRVSELFNLNEEDIQGNSVFVNGGKGNKSRVVQMNEQTRIAIGEYVSSKKYHSGNALFVSQKNNRLAVTTIQETISKYVDKANLDKDISPHSLRHTNATMLLENGTNLKVIQEILGHSSLVVTQKYLHTNKEAKQEAVSKIKF